MKYKKTVFLLIFLLMSNCLMHAQQGTIYTTAKDTNLKLSKSGNCTFVQAQQPYEIQACVFVDSSKQFQTVIGIGSALTDAAAETFFKLPKKLQDEILTAFYDKEKGIGYTFARTSINSCDFSSDSYCYVQNNDSTLKTFNIAHDKKYRIPLIKKAIAAAGGNLPLLVSPWSPPAWMKTNNNMLQGGALLPKYRQAWANYFVKFINAYEKEGIPIFALTVQNEPMARQTWESCIYTAKQEGDFVQNYLGPTLEKSGLSDKKIVIWDHNRDLIYHRAENILEDSAASKYVWGIGYHWYETWSGNKMMFDNVRNVHEAFPNKHLLFTEGCVEHYDRKRINDWALGEKYGYSMINDFNSGVEGWLDWNMMLDKKGGPNHVGNFCFAPLIADTQNNTLYYTNIYYYIGQFSKFVRPGARRIAASTNRDGLLACAFQNPDKKMVVIVMNQKDMPRTYQLFVNSKMTTITSLPHSISTIVLN